MATLREIKRQITSVRSTQQITKAMKMVAAAKLRKAQNQLLSSRPYARELEDVMGHVAGRLKQKRHPLLENRRTQKVCFVVITSDRGLCGSFNSNIIRRAVHEFNECPAQEKYLITIGRKGNDFFRRRNHPILANHIDLFNALQFSSAQAIAGNIMDLFLARKINQVYVIYNEFKSAIQQKIVVEPFLPVRPITPPGNRFAVGFIYEPNPDRILRELCPLNLNIQIWRILLESCASEFGARMVAMETATNNAEDMIKELVLYYNKSRQAAITKELNEIVSGAEALKG